MKVGDYVRTNDGIKKVEIYEFDNDYENCNLIYYKGNDFGIRYTNKELPKSSPNIIDLIEVGDYVNGEKIVSIGLLTNGPEKGTKTIDYYIAPNTLYYFKNEDIKSIVTKEQFEEMKYDI